MLEGLIWLFRETCGILCMDERIYGFDSELELGIRSCGIGGREARRRCFSEARRSSEV